MLWSRYSAFQNGNVNSYNNIIFGVLLLLLLLSLLLLMKFLKMHSPQNTLHRDYFLKETVFLKQIHV